MARRNQPEIDRVANLSVPQMQEAIRKIDRRLIDLDEFKPELIGHREDPNLKVLEKKLATLITSIFGPDTIEYCRYFYDATTIDTATYNYAYGTDIHLLREGLVRGVAIAKATLKSIRDGFIEELSDVGLGANSTSKALRAYEGLELHPDIEHAAGSLYRNGHYTNAIEDAVKALNNLVRLRSGVDDKDGVNLMEYVFNPKNPVLKFNNLTDQSDYDEQRGFMFMLSGSVAGLRNPRAHRLMNDDPERSLEFIAFISLLAKMVSAARR